jgi:HPt (histidine-containing phosphotransfer) domain-containing protein
MGVHMATATILDRDHFGHMTGGDLELQAEIIELFRAQAELWRRLLIVDAPLHTWRDAAHTVKGSARGLGLWALAEACERAEAIGRTGLVESVQIAQALAQVRAALEEALDALPEPITLRAVNNA